MSAGTLTKRCRECNRDKPLTEFDRLRRRRDGLQPIGRDCRALPPLRHTDVDPMGRIKRCTKCGIEKRLEAYCRQKGGKFGRHPRCRECRSEQEQIRYRANRDTILAQQRKSPARKQWRQGYRRQRKYGLTAQEFDAMVNAQGGLCALGHAPADGALVVDHDHATGKVRRLLCRSCNAALGMFEENLDRLRAAITYLEEHCSDPRLVDRETTSGKIA